MASITRTLLDPLEVAAFCRAPLSTLDEVTEWFSRAAMLDEIASLQELRESPRWTPEPMDRRWRARGWDDDSLT